jgi:hydroxyacylglutathione hydrolase
MTVERIWTANAHHNHNDLIACGETGEALAIDPLDSWKWLAAAKDKAWQITQILNTHEHHGHNDGNAAVVAVTGAKVIAQRKAGSRIAGVDLGVMAGDVVRVGRAVELECLDTPGRTKCHICLRSHTDRPALFSGHMLFNAGAGNC